ncbi:hypothetical protein DPEC_G00027110 [Dallia pectoralis]|uniref:Uncharacterized protein n=1 Tax=Dallia pectoralis TaxID=75939 RepID=A0ACC2HI71_DALPE|nr:hypothetical protein DPEC_G00027110 [Dallia pectoralis]
MGLLVHEEVLIWGKREPLEPASLARSQQLHAQLLHEESTDDNSYKSASGNARTSGKWQEATSCELRKLANEEDGRGKRRLDVFHDWADVFIVTREILTVWSHVRGY